MAVMELEMSEKDRTRPEFDCVQVAMEYSKRLQAELAMVEAFLVMAEALSATAASEDREFALPGDDGMPRTIH
jgi:hypothetical protein